MINNSPQSAGGQVMAIRQREEALRKYYSDPNVCKYCSKPIKVRNTEKVCEVRKKKFCNRSCAASYNNFGRFLTDNRPAYIKGYCKECGDEIIFTKNKSGRTNKRKYCSKCLESVKIKKRGLRPVFELTKGEIFSIRTNWQSARSAITKHARKVFNSSNLKKECKVCGYNKHINISHIKDVSDFDNDVLITEINNINNLVALCPNHHWEFDNHSISEKDLRKIR